MKTIRIGSGAGYAGDRIEPAIELMEVGNLNYIIFECLAERTIALSQLDKLKNSQKGYNPLLEYRMRKILPLAKEKKVKVITNMGAANPKSAVKKVQEIAFEMGITGLKIACVTGDDVWKCIEDYYEENILESGETLEKIKDSMLSANAYLGCEGVVKALQDGADIIITGRLADPALTIGPLVYEFNWNIQNNSDEMGQAVLAGHLLECAGQVTGGYFADPGYKEVPNLDKLGFPLIEMKENGEFIITKVEGSGGLVSEETCKEQMIYEIHNPKAYMTPDAIADFSKVQFTLQAKDQVRVTGATSHGRPETLKVSIGYKDCYIAEAEISYGGSNCMKRAELAADIVEKRLKLMDVKVEEYRVDFIGYNSLYKDKISNQLAVEQFSEIRLRISARTLEKEDAYLAANEVETLYTNGPAGGGGVTKKVSDVISVCSIFIPRDKILIQTDYSMV